MARTFRIGVLGLTHDHVWRNLQELTETGAGVVVAAADPHPPLLEQARVQFGCAVHGDYEALLAQERLDAVYIFADNATGARLAERTAAHGLHILIEKPMAADLAGADRMLAAARLAGVRLMVNWPFAWLPQLQHALQLALAGDLGPIWQVRYRAAHAGPREIGCSPFFYSWLYDPQRNGAGALMDYCCYGAALARYLLGMPARVTAAAGRLCKEDILVEDNAVLVLTYPRALALTEGSWTQVGHTDAYVPRIYGARAELLVEPHPGGQLRRATAEKPDGVVVEVPEPPAEMRTASAHFLHCLETGAPFTGLCDARVGRDTQEILAAGLLAVERGSEVSLPLRGLRERT